MALRALRAGSVATSRRARRRSRLARRTAVDSSSPALLPAGRLRAADVVALQDLVGNRAAQRAIQRQERRAADPAAGETAPDPARFLAAGLREALGRQLTLRLATAYADYARACEEVKQEISDEIEQETEFATLVTGIFLGPAGSEAERLFHDFVDNTPAAASAEVARAALLAVDYEDEIQDFADEHAPGVADQLVAAAASTEEDADAAVMTTLESGFRQALDEIAGSFEQMADSRLIAIWINYDPRVATLDHYRREVRKAVERGRGRRRAEADRRRREQQLRQEEQNRDLRAGGAHGADLSQATGGSRVR